MNTDNSGAIFLIAAFVVYTLYSLADTVTINADYLECGKYVEQSGDSKNSQCKRKEIVGSFKVGLSKNSNICSLYYRRSDSVVPNLSPGSLVYVDKDNWKCERKPNAANLIFVASMHDGNLSMEAFDTDSVASSVDYDVELSDGFLGTARHWYRVITTYIYKK